MKDSPIDPEDLKPYFYWIGLTFYSCHQLEYGVKTVLVTMADMGFGGFDLAEMIDVIENEKKKTLGQVLALLRQRVTLSDGWATSLSECDPCNPWSRKIRVIRVVRGQERSVQSV